MGQNAVVPHLAQLAVGFTGPWRGPPTARIEEHVKLCPGLWRAHFEVYQHLPPPEEAQMTMNELRNTLDMRKRGKSPKRKKADEPSGFHDHRGVTFIYWSEYPQNHRVEQLFAATVWEHQGGTQVCVDHYEEEELKARLVELGLAGPYIRAGEYADWWDPKVPENGADSGMAWSKGAFYVHPLGEDECTSAPTPQRGTIWISRREDALSCREGPKPRRYPFKNWREKPLAWQRALTAARKLDPHNTCKIEYYGS